MMKSLTNGMTRARLPALEDRMRDGAQRFEQVQALVDSGTKISEACKQIGYTTASYYSRRRKAEGTPIKKRRKKYTKRQPRFEPIAPAPELIVDNMNFSITGSPEGVARFIKTLREGSTA